MKLTALILAGLLALTGLSFGETVIEEAYEEPIVTLMGTVNEFTQEGLLLDTEMGPVLVLTNEETLLEGFDALEKLEAGRQVEVMYNGMMTRSIPARPDHRSKNHQCADRRHGDGADGRGLPHGNPDPWPGGGQSA